MGKEIRTHDNVYVFDHSKVNFYLRKVNESWLWHRRLGHMNFDSLIRVRKLGAVRGFPRMSRPDKSIVSHVNFVSRVELISIQKSSLHIDHWS